MESKIFITKPCTENWSKMTVEEKGRHCAVCSKVVKDFTGMQTNEIVQELQKTTGEVCGRVDAKNLTPANTKQQVDFWIKSLVFRKAIYPLMALLGVSFLTKKANAQISHDYPVKGEMAVSDYHTQRKVIKVVVKDYYGNAVNMGSCKIVAGVRSKQECRNLDTDGRIVIQLEPKELIGTEIELMVKVPNQEIKRITINLIKNVQTVEVKMEEEYMIMGDIYYEPEVIEPNVNAPDIDTIIVDSVKTVNVETLTPQLIQTLPFLQPDINPIEKFVPDTETTEPVETETYEDIVLENTRAMFNVYPVPTNTVVNIVSNSDNNYQVNVFDGEGKTRQTVMNCAGTYTLDVTNYVSGIYYLQLIVDGKAIETKKVVVTK